MAKTIIPQWRLPALAESALYRKNPRAWGYLKAMTYERDTERLRALGELLNEQDKEDISAAFEQANQKP